jgi:hypothetical protein
VLGFLNETFVGCVCVCAFFGVRGVVGALFERVSGREVLVCAVWGAEVEGSPCVDVLACALSGGFVCELFSVGYHLVLLDSGWVDVFLAGRQV